MTRANAEIKVGMKLRNVVTQAVGVATCAPYRQKRYGGIEDVEYVDVHVQTPQGTGCRRTWRTESVRKA